MGKHWSHLYEMLGMLTATKFLQKIDQTTWGNIEGNSGSPGYSSIANAVISLWGNIGATCMNVGYVDSYEVPAEIDQTTWGNIEGNSGSPGYYCICY